MAAQRWFLVIAYDVASNRRRNRVVKLLKGYGRRVNFSVFECSVRARDFQSLRQRIEALIDPGEDSVLYYSLCSTCVDRKHQTGMGWQTEAERRNAIF